MTANTTEAWLFELKHYKTFCHVPTDTSDPYVEAMHTYQTFTSSIIDKPEGNDPACIDLVNNGALQALYDDLPAFNDQVTFKAFVKDGTMKHPLRRTAKQHRWIHIVQSCKEGHTIIHTVHSALAEIDEWQQRAYATESLLVDPDMLYFFRNKNQVTSAGPSPLSGTLTSDGCVLCTEPFDNEAHAPESGPCGHIVCHECFDKSLRHQSSGLYTCALCRACLVCGTSNCNHHTVQQDLAPPVPLNELLSRILPDKAEPLYGLQQSCYWQK
jgi:hypothetical protein